MLACTALEGKFHFNKTPLAQPDIKVIVHETPQQHKTWGKNGVVKLVWKVVTMIINRRLNESIAFHSFLRGFQAGRSTGTASLDTKLLRKLMAMR